MQCLAHCVVNCTRSQTSAEDQDGETVLSKPNASLMSTASRTSIFISDGLPVKKVFSLGKKEMLS